MPFLCGDAAGRSAVQLYDAVKGKHLSTFAKEKYLESLNNNLAFTPDSKYLIAAGWEDARPPRVWDTTTREERPVFEFPR